MTQINIKITGATALAEKTGILTSGMVGVPVRFTFDSEWDDLEAIAVFSGSDEIVSWPMLGEKATVVPWEVLKIPNTVLKIGVEGRLHDGTIVIPTIWATVGTVMPGANATDNLAQPPTPTPFDRIMSTIGEMSELTTEAKDSLVAAINEVHEGVESILTPEEVEEIAGAAAGKLVPEIDRKLDKPNTAPEVGKVLKVKSVNEDGTFTCEWADDSAGAVDDVRINGESIVTDGMATVPVATGDNNKFGLMRVQSNDGISVNSEGQLSVASASESHIDGRNSSRPVVPTNLDYAVKAAMCDGKGATWTDEEQAAARERMGIDAPFELIEEITLEEDILNLYRSTAPDGKSYDYKRLVVLITSSKTEYDDRPIYVRFSCANKNSTAYCSFRKNTTYYMRAMYECRIENKRMEVASTDLQIIYGNQNSTDADPVSFRKSPSCVIVSSNITSIAIFGSNSKPIPAGFFIQIYGVRA